MKYLIVGFGNLGHAQAAHLSYNGYDVNIINRTISKLTKNLTFIINQKKFTTTVNNIGGFSKDLIADRDMIIICTPANTHKNIIEKLVPFLTTQCILLHPGQVFGAINAKKILDSYNLNHIVVAEVESTILTCRFDEISNQTYIYAIKREVSIAATPSDKTDIVYNMLPLYKNNLRQASSVYETSLLPTNYILHMPIVLCNISNINNGKEFLYYIEGMSKKAWFLMCKIDNERMSIARKLNVPTISIMDWFNKQYIDNDQDVYEFLTDPNNKAYGNILAPKILLSRHITEDFPCGLEPIRNLAKSLNIETPYIDLCYEIITKLII